MAPLERGELAGPDEIVRRLALPHGVGLVGDPDGADETLSVASPDGTITTQDGRELTLDTHYTIDAAGVFALTAAGLALFNDLDDTDPADIFVLNYAVSDGTDTTANTLTVTVNGGNDALVQLHQRLV